MEEIYREALYEVLGEAGFVLRVGQYSEALAALYEKCGCSSAAFLTAYNPGSVKYSDSANQAAQAELETLLKTAGISYFEAIGKDPDPNSNWPGEQSVLAVGITQSDAIKLAAKFRQAAIVWCPSSATPELQMLGE